MTATTSYHASAEPPRQPIPGANWPRRGTALGGQLRQPTSRKEADPPSESIQSAGAGGKTQQYGSSGGAGESGSVANAGGGRGQAGASEGLGEEPLWRFSLKSKRKMLQTPAHLSRECPARSPRPGTLVCLHRTLATADSKLKARGRGSCQSLLAANQAALARPPPRPRRCVYLPGVRES